MSIVDSTIVNVLNYSDSYVSIPTQIRPDGYLFEPSLNEEPYAIPLSFAEIRVVNSQSSIFREGTLRFEQELEQEVYEKLGLRDWENILSDAQIRSIILKPTKEGLDRFVKIMSSSMFERVRGMMVQLDNSGMYDISTRAKDVINKRYQELYVGKRISEISIVPTLEESNKVTTEKASLTVEELTKIKEEISAELIAEMKKSEVVVETKTEEVEQVANETKKSGRPASNK
jgi:hypothetical protein